MSEPVRKNRLRNAIWYALVAVLSLTAIYNYAMTSPGEVRTSDGLTARLEMATLRPSPRVVTSVPDFRNDIDLRRLAPVLSNLRPLSPKAKQVSVLVATHALRLWGPDAKFPEGEFLIDGLSGLLYSYSCPRLLALLLDGDQFQSMFSHGQSLLSWTAHGISVRHNLGTFGELPVNSWPDHEAHIDKVISVLGEIGIPINDPVRAEGRDGTVADMLRDSMWRLTLGQELEWSAKAYLYFLQLPAHWTNRFGQEISVEDMLNRITQKSIGSGPCLGTHGPQAIALALRIDREEAFLSPKLRSLMKEHMYMISRLLDKNQNANGSWSADWAGPRASRAVAGDSEVITQLRATGHHLEWIAISPKDLRPEDTSIARAIHFLQSSLGDLPAVDFYYHYPLLSHAGAALVRLSGRAASSLVKN